ncbi:amidase family protein [Nonomuraea ferruginea]
MVPLADGSDMGGSLRNPASFCNVAGLRPTPGRVPAVSEIAAWYTLSVQGPMARNVDDLSLMLSVISGFDPRSPYAIKEAYAPEPEEGVAGLRVAWSPDLGGLPVDAATAAVTATAPAVFERLGARVEEVELDLEDAEVAFRTYRAWFYALAYGELDGLGANTAWNVERGREVTGADLARAERARSRLYQRMADFFDSYDVLIAPVSQVPPFPAEEPYVRAIDGVELPDYLAWMRSAYWVSVLHAPAASVPAGFTPSGLPVGGPDHRPSVRRRPRPAGGPRLRTGHRPRLAPPAPLTASAGRGAPSPVGGWGLRRGTRGSRACPPGTRRAPPRASATTPGRPWPSGPAGRGRT